MSVLTRILFGVILAILIAAASIASADYDDVLMGGGLLTGSGSSVTTGFLTEDSNLLITEDNKFLVQE